MGKDKKNKKKNSKASTLKKVLLYVGKYKWLVALSTLLALGVVGLTLLIPVLVGDAINGIAGKGDVDFDLIKKIILIIAAAVAGVSILQWCMNVINNKVTYSVTQDIRARAIRKITTLPLGFIDSHAHGETVNKVITDVEQFADGLLLGFTQLFTGVVTIVATFVLMISINWIIGLAVALLTPLSLFIAKFIAKNSYKMFHLQSKSRADQTAFVEEMISNEKVVKAFSHEDEALDDFKKTNDLLYKHSLRAVFFSSLTNPTTRFVNSVIYAIVALVGAFACISADGAIVALTVGQLVTLLAYTNQYTKPFNEISEVVTEFQNALACASRVFELIEEKSEEDGTEDIDGVDGNVELKNVDFSYVESKPLIENLSVSVKAGQRVAIVGPTGCGKTTLINLLMRFYDVKGGAVEVDGVNVNTLKRHSLRRKYGMVLQETWLKHGTIKENISMGKHDATDEEIIEAAKAAHSHNFIMQMPKGYDTVIGEDGLSLSQGQKQLLCITRVMLALPPMLILDEATSSIDTRTEMQIQSAFQKLTKDKTSFIVAHRLSTIKSADKILVMKNGTIIEQGTHDSLIAEGGFYAALYNSQFAKI